MCVICPYNWLSFRGKCYFISEDFKSWASSEEDCQSRQSHLAIIGNDFIEDKEMSRRSFWIGLQYNDNNSEWTWIDGSTLRKGRCVHPSEYPRTWKQLWFLLAQRDHPPELQLQNQVDLRERADPAGREVFSHQLVIRRQEQKVLMNLV
ncbi:hypothetical protein NDU88_000694 [Pleurodeles waltl]|uniref:C-type lectin domain-containing protein n=1 Tax=Pleurodeles waltl TaxID=8319 RepID=A0AAV7P215_PLEWA|nr:hypothetical protein NDU88_000694 [Pleurodeles waltl]